MSQTLYFLKYMYLFRAWVCVLPCVRWCIDRGERTIRSVCSLLPPCAFQGLNTHSLVSTTSTH